MTQRKRILICTQYVNPSSNSTGYFWSLLVKSLRDSHDVLVISCDCKDKLDTNFHVKAISHNKNILITRLFGLIFLTYRMLTTLKRHARPGDLVMTGTNPIFLILFMPLLKTKLNLKWVLLVHDLYPWNLFHAKSSVFNLIKMPIEYLFTKIYNSCSQIIVIGRDMREILSSYTNSPVEVIQNWVCSDDVKMIERSKSSILNSLGWGPNDIVFQFFGNMGRLQDIDNVLMAIKNVQSPNAKFIFIGNGAKSYKVLDFLNKENPSNVKYLGALEMAQNSEGLAACDVSIVSLASGMYGLGVPSKFYFSLAAGKSILAVMDAGSEISRSVKEHNLGWCCESGDPASLASQIDKICDQGAEFCKGNHREVFTHNYDSKILLPKILNILNHL
jgi:glycosyltransferase involved in cell wall biosynthesis